MQPERSPYALDASSFWLQVGMGVLVALFGAGMAWVVVQIWPTDAQSDLKPLVDRFVQLRRDQDGRAWDLLDSSGPDANEPVTEAEAEAIQAATFLRSPELTIVAVWHGEPTGTGKLRPVPNRFTLVTQGGANGPPLRIREGDHIRGPERRILVNPDIIVEVRDGKIRAVRPQLHEAPDG
jgi:hypothetical protein